MSPRGSHGPLGVLASGTGAGAAAVVSAMIGERGGAGTVRGAATESPAAARTQDGQ
jgi:hypothetical protein